MVSLQVESFTFVTAVVVIFLSTSPSMSEGQCNFGSNDVLQLVHNDPSRGTERRWVKDGEMYPGFLCRIREGGGSGGIRSVSDPMFYKNGVLLEASSRISGGTLTFRTFTVEDQGQYECGCSSTFKKSNEIILFVTPPKSKPPPPSFVVKYGNEVTINCPLIFLTFGDLPTFYKVDWRNSQDDNLVEGSMVVSPMVSFDNQTLQLTILNVMSDDEEYRCVITQFYSHQFNDELPSDPVGIHALGHQRVSVELSQPTIATGETTTINCSQASPSYNPVYRLELVEDDSTEPKVYQGISVYNYTAKSVSVNVTCIVTQHSNATMPQDMVNDINDTRIIVVGTIQLNSDKLTVEDDKGCIQVLRVEYTSMPTTMELMYTITPDRNEPCPPKTQSGYNIKSTLVPTDGNLRVNLTGVTHDGTRVDLYVRVWMRHDGVNGRCSDAVQLERADETCYGILPIRFIVGIAVAAVIVGIIIIATPVVCSIIFCRWLRRRGNEVDFPQEDPRDQMRRREK